MMPATLILRTKLLPPRAVTELLPRPRLTDRLLAHLAHPVTLVTANAGSGKTTLVADFLRQRQFPYVWYQLDNTDADPLVFLSYLGHGIRQAVPAFGATLLTYVKEAADELAQHPERGADVLLNEVLEQVEQKLILVLDDYHHLGHETSVHRVVDRLLAYLPEILHVIIISREMPPLAVARMRSQSSLALIDRADLLFTDEEMQELFRNVFDLEITPAQLREYRERTHGWITALQLVRQVAQRRALASQSALSAEPDLVAVLRQSERDIFDYFAEEVFAGEDPEVQYLLLRISLLERVEAGLCARLHPGARCHTVLPQLVRRNVFVTVASDERGEEYRLHPLFQNFLRRRLRNEIGRSGVAAEHVRYADYFLRLGQWEQGVRHLIYAEEFKRAAAALAQWGQASLASSGVASLMALSDALPAAALEAHPRALAYRAEAARLCGDLNAAQPLLHRAATLLRAAGDAEGEAEVLHSLATIARRRGDHAGALGYLDRALDLSDAHSALHVKCGNTRGLCYLTVGNLAAAEREFRLALQTAEERGDEVYARLIAHNLGLPAMVRGDFGTAQRWLQRMLRADGPLLPRDAIGHLNLARCHLYRGEFATCEHHLKLTLQCSQIFNLKVLQGEILETYGNFYRDSGDTAHAAEFYERAARAYEEAQADVTQHELMEEQSLLSMQIGDYVAARSRIEHLLEARTQTSNELGQQTARLAYGRILFACDTPAAARAVLQPAFDYFHNNDLKFYEAQAALALALACERGDREVEMLTHLRRAVELAARYDYEYWLQEAIKQFPHLFARPEASELLPADMREYLPSPSVGTSLAAQVVAPAQVALPAQVTDLTIKLLGPVEIWRDPARPLAVDAWVTRRSRDILCFIAAQRHRRALKDTIIDVFWGDADFEVVEKNFHPTISHIRKALNSNQVLKQNFVVYRDGAYQLAPSCSYYIDIEEFDSLAQEAEKARRARDFEACADFYERAVTLYRGEFMVGVYDAWCDEPRSYYREQYLRMLESLASFALKKEDWNHARQLAQEILRDDPFREDMHCLTMQAHAALGHRGAVKEQYQALCRLLQEELGVTPAAETQAVYRALLT